MTDAVAAPAMTPAADAVGAASSTAPVLSAAWLTQHIRPGERYAGIILGHDGTPSHHLILLPGAAADVTWDEARAWAEQSGGELPTRREQAILFGNARGEFKADWYWSSEQHAAYAGSAWLQGFSFGIQITNGKSASLRARAVRRLPI